MKIQHDIILETTESCCGDCSEISGSQAGTACRTWFYQGESHTEAPIGMIVEAILGCGNDPILLANRKKKNKSV